MGDIRSSIEAAVRYLTEHPDEARYTDSRATATLEEGLKVRVTGPGGGEATTDMPTSVGGGDSAPSPGWLFRAALASCEATLIGMAAAREGVALTKLEVEVDTESDDYGILGIDETVPAGPLSISVRVHIAGDAPADKLQEVVAWGVEHCPVDDIAIRAVPRSLDVAAG